MVQVDCTFKIKENPTEFATEFNGILKALADRIEKEEYDLYSLADSLADVFIK